MRPPSAGLVDDATVAQIAPTNAPRRWRGDPVPTRRSAELVGDRFGAQVVTRSVDPLLAGVYAGSAATIGLRAALPPLAAALDRGARSLTDAVREAWRDCRRPPAGSVFGAVDGGYRVLVDELVRRAGFPGRRSPFIGSSARPAAGISSTTKGCTGTPTVWCSRCLRPDCRVWSNASRRGPRRGSPAHRGGLDGAGGAGACLAVRRCPSSPACWWPGENRCTPRR